MCLLILCGQTQNRTLRFELIQETVFSADKPETTSWARQHESELNLNRHRDKTATEKETHCTTVGSWRSPAGELYRLILTGSTLFVSPLKKSAADGRGGRKGKGQWTVSRISAWGSEPNVNKFCTEAEEESRTINKIKPITATEAPSVSLFQALWGKKRPAGHRNLLFPVREHQHGCQGVRKILTIQVFMVMGLQKTAPHFERNKGWSECLRNNLIITNTTVFILWASLENGRWYVNGSVKGKRKHSFNVCGFFCFVMFLFCFVFLHKG